MRLTKKIPLLSLALAATLAGCGLSGPQIDNGSVSSLQAQAVGTPTQAQLDALAAESPDHLVENAPNEPGATWFWPSPPPEDLGNFGKVNANIWRGARPSDAGLQKLKDMGVKTIVDVENAEGPVDHEQAWCQAHGVNFVSIPLSVILPPKLSKIQQFLALAENPADLPLYVHCMQGSDRTGTVIFCYRMSHDGWSYKQAYAEMVSYHFHTFLLGIRAFLVWYADTQVPAQNQSSTVSGT